MENFFYKNIIEFLERFESENTRRAYRRILTKFLGWSQYTYCEIPTLEHWNASSLREWISSDVKPCSAATLSHTIGAIRSFDNFLRDRHGIAPQAKNISLPHVPLKPVSSRAYDALPQLEEKLNQANSYREFRNAFLPTMLLTTGLRISEALNLKSSQVNLSRSVLEGIRLKGSDYLHKLIPTRLESPLERFLSKRNFAITNFFSEREQIAPKELPFFVSFSQANVNDLSSFYWHTRSASRAISEIFKPLGFAHVTPHSLRHAYAIRLLDISGDVRLVQQELGHRSILTTMRYTQRTFEQRKRILENL